MRRTAAVIALAVLLVAAPAAVPRQDAADERERLWREAVRTHVAGEADRAVAALASWSNDELQLVVARTTRLRPDDLARSVWPESPDAFLRRAIVLHTDVAVLAHENGGYRLPPTDRAVTIVGDGERQLIRSGTVQWSLARQLAGRLSKPAEDAFLQRWYEATSAQLQSWSDYAELVPHLAEGLRLFDKDARLFLYRAAMHEDFAGSRIQSAIGTSSSLPPPLGGPLGPRRRPVASPDSTHPKAYELNAAEDDLRRALALDDSLPEAALRLGHVLGEKGRHDDAAAALARALAMPGLTTDLQYVGWLLLGRERAALDDAAGARDALERAAGLVPGAQSAHVALSQLARSSGDRARALEALQVLSSDAMPEDPWWFYSRAHAPTPEVLLDAVRRSAGSGGAPR